MDRIRVLIADDEVAVREALADLIGSDTSMELAGAACDADEAIDVAREARPHVALVDVKMPAGGGVRAARGIREESPETQIVALSAYEDRRTVMEMLRAGVVGYIVKGSSAEEILYTIRRAMQGQGSLSVEVTADVIHELASLLDHAESLSREPITTIQGFAMTVAERGSGLTSEETRALADGVSDASDRIRRLLGNLAAASRLDRSGVELATQPLPLEELLRAAAGEFPDAGERLVVPQDPSLLGRRVWADADLAVRALVAVIENALSFSPGGEPVTIAARTRADEIDLVVTDRGPGIAYGVREQIFDAFTQADPSTTRHHEGLGIGLYLAKRIMTAHKGSIGVETEEPGATFVLTFPALQELRAEIA
jgi:signal transduction histidine kinase